MVRSASGEGPVWDPSQGRAETTGRRIRRSLLGGLAFAQARLDRFKVVLDVGVAGIAGLRLQQRVAGAARVAAQHVGVAAVVEDLRRGACDLGRLIIGAIGEIEAALSVVRGGQADPGFEVARMQLDRAAEVTFRQVEIARLEVFLAELELVIGRRLGGRGWRAPWRGGGGGGGGAGRWRGGSDRLGSGGPVRPSAGTGRRGGSGARRRWALGGTRPARAGLGELLLPLAGSPRRPSIGSHS